MNVALLILLLVYPRQPNIALALLNRRPIPLGRLLLILLTPLPIRQTKRQIPLRIPIPQARGHLIITHPHLLILRHPPSMEETLPHLVDRQHQLSLHSTHVDFEAFAHSFEVADGRFGGFLDPFEPECFVFGAAPAVAEGEAVHEHPDTASAALFGGPLKTSGGFLQAVGFVVLDAELEVVLRCARAGGC